MTEEAAPFAFHPQKFALSYRESREIFQKSVPLNDAIDVNRPTPAPQGTIRVAAIQLESSSKYEGANSFRERAIEAIKVAVIEHSANLVLLQELFLGPYFCQSQDATNFELAECWDDDDNIISFFQELAKTYNVVLPISLFERKNNAYYNSVVVIDSDGTNLGTYRKSHIPDGTGYQEKFYFSPGDTGFKVFQTSVGTIGVGICWDQWFPEAARSMALLGADVLLYPTAIGSEPQDPTLDSADHWQRVMQGHAAANMIPVVASNRVGTEVLLDDNGQERQRITFYGRSFITNETGEILKEAGKGGSPNGRDILVSDIITGENRANRAAWGLFRDRRPELYGILQTKDGSTHMK